MPSARRRNIRRRQRMEEAPIERRIKPLLQAGREALMTNGTYLKTNDTK